MPTLPSKIFNYFELYRKFPTQKNFFLRNEYDALWPLFSKLGWLYRRLILRHTKIVAVIGSMGKTTTMRALDTLFTPIPRRTSPSNYGSCLAENLFRYRHGDSYAVFEVAIDSMGEMRPYAKMLKPNIAVVTSIKSDHNRSFPRLEVTRHEKADLLRILTPNDKVFLNGDDPNVRWMGTQTSARIHTFGLQATNDVFATDIHVIWPGGTRFTLHTKHGKRRMFVRLLGPYMVYSILAAICAGLAEGKALDEIIPSVESLPPTPMRMETILLRNGAYLIDDTLKGAYESYKAAIDIFGRIPCGRRIAVLGDVEEPPKKVRDIAREFGRELADICDWLILVGQSSLRSLRSAAVEGGMNGSRVHYVRSDMAEGIDIIKNSIREGDLVLIKGRNTQKFRRITLALKGCDVRCTATYCNVKAPVCDECPLLSQDVRDSDNHLVKRKLRF